MAKDPSITASQRQALRDLLKKQGGAEVAFVNIADAQALTQLGLAARTQQGWHITDAGVRLLSDEPAANAPEPSKPTLLKRD